MKTVYAAAAAVLALLSGSAPHSSVPGPMSEPSFTLTASRDPSASLDLDGLALIGATPALGAGTAFDALLRRQPEHDDDASPTLAHRYYDGDLEAMRLYRPGFRFWRHVFTVPDGRIAFGSASDGRLLATFPLSRRWSEDADWADSSLSALLAGQSLAGRLSARRDETATRLTAAVGPVVYHETRGSFIAEGTERYGSFLGEWGAIFERFGVPAEIGLAQALVESGLKGRIHSEAEAIGLCQWLPRNWERLQKLSPNVIEAYNQTTQVPYCAAHLAILATKYGSLIPALSEHHAGGVNVGRTIMNGEFAGGDDVRARYFLGAELTLLVRQTRVPGYREVAGSFGPRSFRYAEMVFGNTETIAELETAMPQQQIFAMRPSRSVPFDEVASRTGLSADEIRRFNPALINRVPAGANLYLPFPVADFGADTAFWHREPTPAYSGVLRQFLRLDERFDAEDWHDGSVIGELAAFARRFRATETEEGAVMATVIAYVIEELSDGRQREILTGVRSSERAQRVLEQGVRQRQALLQSVAGNAGGWAYRNAFVTTASPTLR